MHTVELLEAALDVAQRAGYRVRHEWLGGSGGGDCELGGRKMLLLDLAMGPAEQLELVVNALLRDQKAATLPMPPQLRELLSIRKIA